LRHPDILVDCLLHVNVGSHVEKVRYELRIVEVTAYGRPAGVGWYLAKRHKKNQYEIMLYKSSPQLITFCGHLLSMAIHCRLCGKEHARESPATGDQAGDQFNWVYPKSFV
jgi:Na+-transporting NADH:ubiquinone oxidoreductase subunit NqrE